MDCFAALAMTLWERSDLPSMRRFMLRLRRCFQMFDRQRTVVRGHFPVVLSRYWIGSPFGPLVEHAGSLNQILGTGHGTPLMQMLASYVGRPTVSYPASPVQIGVLNRFRPTGPSSRRREPEPAHLHQARPAIAAVSSFINVHMVALRCLIVSAILRGDRFPALFAGSGKWLRRRRRVFRGRARMKPLHETGTGIGIIRSSILTIFWRCGLRYFSV